VLRKAVEQLRPDLRDVGYEAIARGINFSVHANTGEEINLIARLNLAVVNDLLVIKTWGAELPDFGKALLTNIGFEMPLGLDKPVKLRHAWQLEAHLLEDFSQSPLMAVKNIQPDEAWLDYDRLVLPLMVRGPREGERFHPLGMQGHSQSIQDLLVNLKIPAHLRSVWPLVLCGEEIAWVVGLRTSDDFKITEMTQRVLVLKLNTVHP